MAQKKLTKSAVEQIPVEETDVVVWDTALPGFGVRVKPTGVRSYVIQYRDRTTGASLVSMEHSSPLIRPKSGHAAFSRTPCADKIRSGSALQFEKHRIWPISRPIISIATPSQRSAQRASETIVPCWRMLFSLRLEPT